MAPPRRLAASVAGALAAAGPVSAALFGDHAGPAGRDWAAALVFLFPVALLAIGGQRMRLAHAAAAAHRRVRRR